MVTGGQGAGGGSPGSLDALFYERLVEHAFDVALVCDRGSRIRYVNPAMERVFGYPADAVVGETVWPLVHPDDHERLEAAFGEASAHPGLHVSVDLRVLRADGEWRWVEAAAVGFLEDPAVAGIVVNARDITDRVLADETLAASAAHLTALLANIGDVVSVHAADGTVRYVSPSAARVVGERAADELAGSDPFQFVVEADRAKVRAAAARWMLGSRQPVEFEVRSSDGEVHSVESSGVNLLQDPHVHGVVVTTRDVTVRRRTEQELQRLALFDTLTGLANRQLVLDRVERALVRQTAAGGSVGILLVDLDDFKAVNDAAGHVAGDELLVEAARRLRRVVRDSDTVGRWGGDEFVVVVESAADADGLAQLSDRILDAMNEPFVLSGAGEVYVGASVGIAVGPEPSEDAHALLAAAEAAMHRAKERGRSRAEVFDEELRTVVVERLRLHSELPRALERDEFELHYQPIIDLATSAVVGTEALIRWRHPTRGLLEPAAFLPVAERSGFIASIGAWVLRTACREAASWTGPQGEALHVAVNLSARQLADPALAGEIEAVLASTGLPASRLTLEVTESAVMADPSTATAILARLRSLGASVAVDDFGTGYSSLGYLRRLPCDVVKVDRTFVAGLGTDEEDTVIVAAVVALAHTLGLVVTAEGCEQHVQAAKLTELGADRAQGYLWARPVPAAELPALVRNLSS